MHVIGWGAIGSSAKRIFAVTLLCVLPSCGGGGGGSSSPPADVPVAIVGGADAVSGSIGAAGGSLSTSTSDVILTVPAGALISATSISLALSDQAIPQGNLVGAPVLELGPSGTTFGTTVKLALRYDAILLPPGIAATDMTVAVLANGKWQEVPSAVDVSSKTLFAQLAHFSAYSVTASTATKQPHGAVLGSFNGVNVYSNGCLDPTTAACGSHPPMHNTSNAGGYDTGLEWQCVELVNRYYYQVYGLKVRVPGDNANAYFKGASARGLLPFQNGGAVSPKIGDLLVSEGKPVDGNVGHVAIVKDVTQTEIVVVQQNWSEGIADVGYRLPMVVANGLHTVGAFNASYPVTGWLRSPTAAVNEMVSPVISVAPKDASVSVGQAATFHVVATGSAPLSYQWFNGATAIPDATASSYTIPSVAAVDDGTRFSVVVSNPVGSTVSASALLTISMTGPAPTQMQRIATGYGHTCAVTAAGGVKCWGGGPLGDGGTWGTSRLTPVDVVGLSSVTAVSAGWFRTCALTNLGGVKCWGNAFPGSGLGDGTSEERLVPVDVVGLGTGVAAVDVGGDHVCALTTAGGVKCWGKNNYGQLGDGTFEDRLTPVNVVGLSSGVVAVSAGGVHTCAVTNLGRVKCWGMNHAAGSLGDGTTTYRFQSTPVDVVGLDGGVAAIAVGDYQTCVLKIEGAVLCWGASGGSGVGDGTDANRSTPVGVFGLSAGVTAIAHGNSYACALIRGGAIKCWGSSRTESYAGGLGDGTNAGSLAPVDAFGLSSGVVAVAAGAGHTCVLMAAGNAKCWGVNYLGGLGDGTQIDRYTPVDVVGF